MPRRAGVLAAVAVILLSLSGCQPEGAFFGEVRTDGVQVSGGWTPVSGDFDANGSSDILWYDGARHEQLWLSDHRGHFTKVAAPADLGAGFTPIVGDFGGDRADDVLWYAGGFPTYRDEGVLWTMAEGGTLAEVRDVALPTRAQQFDAPVLVTDRDSRDAVAFIVEFGDVTVWDADRPGAGATAAVAHDPAWGRTPAVLAGDFDGDGSGDLFVRSWGAVEQLAWGDGGGDFDVRPAPREVNHGYDDVVELHLDFNATSDIAFVGQDRVGTPANINVWFGRSDRTFGYRTLPGFPGQSWVEVHQDTTGAAASSIVSYTSDGATALSLSRDGQAHISSTNPVTLGPPNDTTRIVGEFRLGGAEDVLVYDPRSRGYGEHLLLTHDGQD